MPPGFAAMTTAETAVPLQRCKNLVLEDLQSRRDQDKATMMLRIVNNLAEIPEASTKWRRAQQPEDIIRDSCQYIVPSTSTCDPFYYISANFENFKLLIGAGIQRP